LSRVIRPQSAASIRNKLIQSLAHAIAFDQQGDLKRSERQDVLAFVVQILDEIVESVSATSNAWEKRGYWVKADRFMREWSWVHSEREQLALALEKPDFPCFAALYRNLGKQLSQVQIPVRMLRTRPWTGAWQRMKSASSSKGC